MSKLFRVIVASIMAVVICAWGAPLRADIDEASEAISISVQIAGSTSLNVNYLITATGAPGAGTLGFDLSGLDLNDGASLWTVADECFRVDYSSNYSWGIRIITDNDDVDGDGTGFAWDDGWDIYVYLAGKFWNTHYFDRDGDGVYETAVEFQVPAGKYKTKIYIELFHE